MITRKQAASWYKRPPSISQKLPWREYDPQGQCFLLQDGKSVAAAFELSDVPSEARTEAYLNQLRNNLQGVFQDAFPEYYDDESPWILQFFVQDELSLSRYYRAFEDYVRPSAKGLPFTKTYLAMMRTHLGFITKPEGLFVDDKVSGNIFRGKVRRIRAIMYRNLGSKSKMRKGRSPVEDLNTVASAFVSKLQGAGVGVRRMNGQDFYEWMIRWFNPSPKIANGNVDQLIEQCPYPGDEAMPYGYDFTERLFFTTPESNQEEGVWYFDQKPHKYLAVTGLNKLPETGHLTVERSFGSHHYGLFDKFPEGSVFQLTVVIQSRELVNNHVDRIERSTKKATGVQGEMIREDCNQIRRMMSNGNFLFPTSMGVYIRGNDLRELTDRQIDVETMLSNNGLVVVDGDVELLAIDSYLRFLPMGYDYSFDKAYLSRSRYLSGFQLAQILPLYGRERGTGHPGLPFFNRCGEPFTVDPLNPQDKDQNSHLLILGTTGSGKSATCVYLMMNLMALYKPRLVIVDAGNSFGLLSDYFKEMGLNVNRVEISLNTPTSLNPFAESNKMLEQAETLRLNQEKLDQLAGKEEQTIQDAREIDDAQKIEVVENRDYMGEMSLAAQLMISGGEKKEQDKIDREDRMIILDALVRTAQAAKDSDKDQMLPEDFANMLVTMSSDALYKHKSARLNEMANGVRVFCKDTLSSQFFNRAGAPWPDADVTILEMGLFKEDGYEAQRALAFMGAMNKTQSLAEANQHEERVTVFFGDECHVVTKNPLTAVAITKCSKMSRKIGLWLWLATQNVEDFPAEAKKLLSMVEFWLCLGMSGAELKEVAKFRTISTEEEKLFQSVRKAAGKYVEGILLCNRFKGLFRNIPPRLALALAMTEKHEKAQRKQLMKQHGITEVEAAKLIANQMMGISEVPTVEISETIDQEEEVPVKPKTKRKQVQTV